MYLLQIGGRGKVRVNLMGSGTILREALAAAEILETEYGVPADVFSVTSFNELRRNALEVERWNMLNSAKPRRTSYLQECFGDAYRNYQARVPFLIPSIRLKKEIE